MRITMPVCVAAALCLAGCEDPSADLQLQVTHAQTELDAAKAEIQEVRAEASRPKEQPAQPVQPAVAAAPPAASEESFREAAKNFSGQLEAELKGATVGAPAYSEVKTVATFHFMLRMPDGSVSGQDVVATAAPDGRWVFPSAGDAVRGMLAAASPVAANPVQPKQPTQPVQNVQPAQPQPQPQQARQPEVNPMPANDTKNVTWGDKPRQPGTVRNPAVAPAPAIPPKPSPGSPVPPRSPGPSLPRADEEKTVSFDKKK